MNEFYNKHYIRLDTKGSIVKGFSDAFEQPEEIDICINEKGGRHFELILESNTITNPTLFNVQRQPIYHSAEDNIIEWTAEERNTLYPIAPPEPSLDVRNRADIDYILMMGGF